MIGVLCYDENKYKTFKTIPSGNLARYSENYELKKKFISWRNKIESKSLDEYNNVFNPIKYKILVTKGLLYWVLY